MNESPEQRALSASTLALVAALACIALFLPPLGAGTVATPLRAVATGVALVVALLLHWVFLAISACRMGRSAAGWVGLSVVIFPVGSAAALILLHWFNDEARAPTAVPHG